MSHLSNFQPVLNRQRSKELLRLFKGEKRLKYTVYYLFFLIYNTPHLLSTSRRVFDSFYVQLNRGKNTLFPFIIDSRNRCSIAGKGGGESGKNPILPDLSHANMS